MRINRAGLSVVTVAGMIVVGVRCGSSTNNCPTGQNNVWTSNGMTATRVEPRNCPYVVKRPNTLQGYAVTVTIPAVNVNSGNPGGVETTIYNSARNVLADNFLSWVTADDPTKKTVTSSGVYAAANSTPIRDSINLLANTISGIGNGWLVLPGKVDSSAPGMSGSANPRPNRTSTWYAVVAQDTLSYRYQWMLNGTQITGATGRGHSETFSSGQQSLAAIVTRSDDTADTASIVVTVSLSSAISGPTGVRPTQTCTWFANPSGGVAPFHYSWVLDGSASGSDQNSWSGLLATGGHSLGLTVTDAVNQSSSTAIGITVDGTQPNCII